MANASASAGFKIGDWVLLIIAVVAGWFVWQWWVAQANAGYTQTQSFGPSGTYTYGATGLTAWSNIPLVPTPLPPTYSAPGSPITPIGIPRSSIGGGPIRILGESGGGADRPTGGPAPSLGGNQ